MKNLILLVLFCSSLFAQERSVEGFVDTYQGIGLGSSGSMMSSRTRLRLKSYFSRGDTHALTSLNAVQNEIVNNESGVNLHEVFVQYNQRYFDVKAGKQIIIWGKADGFKVTDIISPQDYSEFMARDFDDMRIPVSAIKARFLGENISLEWIWIPVFTPAVSPTKQDGVIGDHDDNPWAQEIPSGYSVNAAADPELLLENSEVALKFSVNSSLMDFSLMAFYGWDDIPAMHLSGTDLNLEYHRMGMFGAEFSIPFSSIVLRGESAYSTNRYRSLDVGSVAKSDLLVDLVGVDWYPGNSWTIGFQVFHQHIVNYDNKFSESENSSYGSLSFSKKLLRDDLNLTAMIFYGFEESDFYGRFAADYVLSDGFHLIGGFDIFAGESGRFGPYNKNDQMFFKAKYSF